MPTPYLKKLAKEGKGSLPELEKKWDEAKEAADKQDQGDNYAYRTSIFKKMVGASAITANQAIASTSYIDKLAQGGKYGTKAELEEKWEEAKKLANENAKANPNIVESYAYTTAIFQDLIGVKKAMASTELTAAQVLARNNYVEKLVRDKKHGSRKEIMKKWEEAKAIANSVGIRAYPYMIAVFQNLLGIRKTAASMQKEPMRIEAATRLLPR